MNTSRKVTTLRERKRRAIINKAADCLATGWLRYMGLFDATPRGTKKQMAALLELSLPDYWLFR